MTTNICDLNIGYLPLGRVTFDMKAAREIFNKTLASFSYLNISPLVESQQLITEPEQAGAAVKKFNLKNMDVLVIQTSTFVDGQFALAVAENWQGPIILWSVDEPSSKGRLRLNSLTGGNLLSNSFYGMNIDFKYIHGNPQDEAVIKEIRDHLNVIATLSYLHNGKLGLFGNHPAGYYPAEYDERVLARLFGVRVNQITLSELFSNANKVKDDKVFSVINMLTEKADGVNAESSEVKKAAKMYIAMKNIIKKNEFLGVATECWPGFFEDYGAAACSTLSLLCDEGIMAACEADINGLISMIIEKQLAGKPSYLGDMVKINKISNTAVFWHCGAGACSLAGEKPVSSVHPNREQALTFDFNLKPGEITIARLNKGRDKHRLLIMKGKALANKENHFTGTSIEIKFDRDITELTYLLMQNGIEHHYALAYGNLTGQLIDLAQQIGISTIKL